MYGYVGYSKSKRAVAAEDEGRLPISRAVAVVASAVGCTRKVARAALESLGPCEWHHTSKIYNKTMYYDTEAAIRYLQAAPAVARLEALDFRAMISRAMDSDELPDRVAAFETICRELADRAETDPETVDRAYYGCWSD